MVELFCYELSAGIECLMVVIEPWLFHVLLGGLTSGCKCRCTCSFCNNARLTVSMVMTAADMSCEVSYVYADHDLIRSGTSINPIKSR